MTLDEAQAVWSGLAIRDEGFLDTAARIEDSRALTGQEQEALDVLWAAIIPALEEVADAARKMAEAMR